jgi:Leucine-rich repeat (LRR) protein
MVECTEAGAPRWFQNKHLASFMNLKHTLSKLSLSGCQIDDTTHLKDLRRLTSLNLCDTQITNRSIDDLVDLPDLKVLHVANTKISNEGVEAALKGLNNLVDFNVMGCAGVSHSSQSLQDLGLEKPGLVFLSDLRSGPRQ